MRLGASSSRIPSCSRSPIAHIDCDAFYASIEKRDRPELTGPACRRRRRKKGRRLSTCCYVARTYGVRSAMPMFKALKVCPEAVVINSRAWTFMW